jgi:ribosome-associated translation inhibitor RaiA
MNIQVRHDNHIEGSARLIDYVRRRLEQDFDRQSNRITHLEVHFSDENGAKHGEHDKKCMIEARPAGMKPVAVSCKGDTVEQVFEGAMDKLHHLLDHTFAKHNSHRRDQPDWREKNEDADPVAEEYEAD